MDIPQPVYVNRVTGDATGIVLPAHGDALLQDGAPWLTEAFRRFGALASDNAVSRIARFESCPGGSTGAKFFLDVEYEKAEGAPPPALFVKFSRDFSDPRRDHPGRYEMAPEAPFMALSKSAGFPITVAEPCFADYDMATGTGVIVTERIPFGEGAIEPHRPKCLDFQTMDDPLPYYRAVVATLARLAAAHKSGRLSPDIDEQFPWDQVAGSADRIRYDRVGLEAKLEHCRAFVLRCPQHFPQAVRSPAFLDRMRRDALLIQQQEPAIQRFLTGNPAMIALNHWNAHIDNCFFWREGTELRCGLIDWGRVGQITFGSALWGALSAAHHDIWDRHLHELLGLFVEEYRGGGGPAITVEALEQHLLIHIAAMGVARVLAFPEVVEFRAPAVAEALGPHDPAILAIEPARNSLHILTVFLKLWERCDFGKRVKLMLNSQV
jgi:hypothetical protein